MNGKPDIVKGRIKEAAGALAGNDELRAEGRTDQIVGNAKELIHQAAVDTKKKARKTIEKLKRKI